VRQFLARQDGIQGGRGAEDASRMGLTRRRRTTCPRRVRRCIRRRLGIRLRPGMHLRLGTHLRLVLLRLAGLRLARHRHRPRRRRREPASARARPPHLAALAFLISRLRNRTVVAVKQPAKSCCARRRSLPRLRDGSN